MDINHFNALGALGPDVDDLLEIPELSAVLHRASTLISTTSSEEYEDEIARSHRRRTIIMVMVVTVVAAVIVIIPTLCPPTPSPSARKRRFSEIESDDDSSSQSAISSSSSAGSSPTSHSAISSSCSAERERRIFAIVMSNLRRELSKLVDLLHKHLEAREEQIQERLERQCLPDAIYRMQEVDSDLSLDDQVTLVDLFAKERNSAMTYLALTSDPVRKAWIKLKLTKASSG